MNLSVFLQALRLSQKTLISACLGVPALLYVSLLGSSTVLDDFGAIAEEGGFLRDPPRAVEALAGGSLDFFTPEGWLTSAIMHPIAIVLLSVVALGIAAGIPTEVERGTLELVLSRPISRTRYLLSKMAASVTALVLVSLCGLGAVLLARITVAEVDQIPVERVLTLFGGVFVTFLSLGMVSYLISARSSLRGRALGLSVGVVVAAFFLNFLGLLFEEVEFLRYLSPFHYLAPGDLLARRAPSYHLPVLGGLALVAMLGALRSFAVRDLTR